jgi:phosphoribosylformimino-5-aminoimidazole carboxamide ribotide isomerase
MYIPAIDLIDGKCVRLEEGDYGKKKIYNADPLEQARQFEDHGLQQLHLVDLDGAKAGKIVNWRVLEKLASQTRLHIDFGGGLKSDDDLRIAFECGARQVNIGSLAVKDPETFHSWLQQHGPDKIILSADTREGKIAVSGWQELTEHDLFPFIEQELAAGVTTVCCTDISRDGKLSGPATELYKELLAEFPEMKLIASGGVSSRQDLDELRQLPLHGIIIGKALYEGKIQLKELRD